MTATLPARPSSRRSHLERSHLDGGWTDQLGRVLRPACFPARQDELLATLIRHRAPSHLLWRLTCLPRTRQFSSLDEVLAFVDGHAPAATVGEPI